MTNRINIKLLWVDDQVNKLGEYVSALKDAGFDLTTANTTEQALAFMKDQSFDVILTDLRMEYPDGIELIKEVHKIQPDAKIAAFSSYLYSEYYRSLLRDLEFDVQLIDKDLPNRQAPDFDKRFILPIKKFAKRGVTDTVGKQDELLEDVANVDPFEISLSEFKKLSMVEKELVALKARELAAPVIEQAFSEGKIWVLLCGSKEEIIGFATTPGDVLSDGEIMELARERKRAPFHFYKDIDSEDILWSSCGKDSCLHDYPTITLEINEEPLIIHFDTGSPMTFFSFEELFELGAINKPESGWSFGRLRTPSGGVIEYQAMKLEIEALLRSQRDDRTKHVSLSGQAIPDWIRSPYARFCKTKCERASERSSKGWLCPERKGLIGRNILVENHLVLILDGKNRKTGIEKEIEKKKSKEKE